MKALVEAARGGDKRALARLVSLLEDHPGRVADLFGAGVEWASPGLTLAVTGPPGVGKSTFVSALLGKLREKDSTRRIAVLAVDPTSPFSGGAVLGDRVRMMEHSLDEGIFIRSFANRGRLGGLAPGIRAVLRLLGLTGWDLALLETVGVGQSEVEAASVADLVAVLLAPGQGDGVQMLKAGLLETADLFVVHKADRPGADRLAAEIETALDLAEPGEGGRPPVLLVSSLEGKGVETFLQALEARRKDLAGRIRRRREGAKEEEARLALLHEAGARLEKVLDGRKEFLQDLLSGRKPLDAAVEELLRAAWGKETEKGGKA